MRKKINKEKKLLEIWKKYKALGKEDDFWKAFEAKARVDMERFKRKGLRELEKEKASIEKEIKEDKCYLEKCKKEMARMKSYLIKNKIAKYCPVCGKPFKYKERKIYCSIIPEGRNCGKKARDARSYQRHRLERLQKSNERMKELRKLYKKHKIKK